MGLLIQKPKRTGPLYSQQQYSSWNSNCTTQLVRQKKFDTGCRKRFGNLHAFPTSEILRTEYDREITTEKEAKSKQSNEHFCICFALNHFTSLTSVVFPLLQKPHRNVQTCICTYISNSSTPSVQVYKSSFLLGHGAQPKMTYSPGRREQHSLQAYIERDMQCDSIQ